MAELIEALGNASKGLPAGSRGISRSQFYEYKRRSRIYVIEEGGSHPPPIHKSHPMTASAEVVEKIPAISLEHLMGGCVRLSHRSRHTGIHVSSPTIQNPLIKS